MIAKGRRPCITDIRMDTGSDTKVKTYTKFAIILDCLLVVLLDVVREVVDRNVVMLDVFHDLDKLGK